MLKGRSKRRLARAIALVFLSSRFVISCGIDTIIYLPLKATYRSSDTSSFVFSGPSASDTSYLGLNVYYRIYASDTDATADLSSITSKQSATNAVPGAYVAGYLASTGGLGYQRVVLIDPSGAASDPIPTFAKADVPPDVIIDVTFPASAEPYLALKLESSGTETKRYLLRRAVSDSSGYLSFLKAPVAAAIDYRTGTVSANQYYVQFFAAAYGLDFNSFSELYGNAVYLGRITINL